MKNVLLVAAVCSGAMLCIASQTFAVASRTVLPRDIVAATPVPVPTSTVRAVFSPTAGTFTLNAVGVDSMTYRIEYMRQASPSAVLEGVTGSVVDLGKAYSKVIEAGTRSRGILVPHKVLSGTVAVKGKTHANRNYTYDMIFSVKNNVVTVSSEKFVLK